MVKINKDIKILLLGSTQGSISIYLWPFTSASNQLSYIEIPIHLNQLSYINITNDQQYLITAGDDSSIFFSKIQEFLNGLDISSEAFGASKKQNQRVGHNYYFNHLSIESQQYLDAKKEDIKELNYKKDNEKSDMQDNQDFYTTEFQKKLDVSENQYQSKKNESKEAMQIKFQQEEKKYLDLQKQQIQMRKIKREIIERLNEKNNEDLLQKYETRDILQEELNKLKVEYKQKFEESKNGQSETYDFAKQEFQNQKQMLLDKYKTSLKNINQDQKKFHEILAQSEQEYNIHYQETREKLIQKLQQECKESEELRGDNSRKIKKIDRYNKRAEYLKTFIRDTENDLENLNNEYITYEKNKTNMENQLKDKEEVIDNREQQIKLYRKKNCHLQNFQKVYDYRVNTLKEEMQPLNDHLNNMDQHNKCLFKELLDEASLNKKIDINIEQFNQDIKKNKFTLYVKKCMVQFSRRRVDYVVQHVYQLLQGNLQNITKELKIIYKDCFEQFQEQIEKVIENSLIGSNLKEMKKDAFYEQIFEENDDQIYDHFQFQCEILSREYQAKTIEFKNDMNNKNRSFMQFQNMNTKLINECNKLREQKRKLKEYLGIQKKIQREVEKETKEEMNQQDSLFQERDESIIERKKPQNKALPFIQYQKSKTDNNTLLQQQQKDSFNINEFKQNESQLIYDLIEQIKNFSSNKVQQSEYLENKQKAQDFMMQEKNDTVMPLINNPGQSNKNKKSQSKASEDRSSREQQSRGLSRGQYSTSSNFRATQQFNSTLQNFPPPNPQRQKLESPI